MIYIVRAGHEASMAHVIAESPEETNKFFGHLAVLATGLPNDPEGRIAAECLAISNVEYGSTAHLPPGPQGNLFSENTRNQAAAKVFEAYRDRKLTTEAARAELKLLDIYERNEDYLLITEDGLDANDDFTPYVEEAGNTGLGAIEANYGVDSIEVKVASALNLSSAAIQLEMVPYDRGLHAEPNFLSDRQHCSLVETDSNGKIHPRVTVFGKDHPVRQAITEAGKSFDSNLYTNTK